MSDFERAKCHTALEARFPSGIVGGDKPSVDGLAFMLYQRLKAGAPPVVATPADGGHVSASPHPSKKLGGGGVIVVPKFNSQ
ncbi:hypothetical protein [Ramlibacter sp. AN1133]|uniref:hypothetical protein n=1 Tax=Ramlibacter sp. AN1133 TaxID=3133429 RepID=UPI0030C5FD1A